jgi:hypothetical protein
MNLNGDEKRIQQLFREMSRGDELLTPAFLRVVQSGSSRQTVSGFGVSRRLALTFATLCVAVITLTVITRRHQVPVVQDEPVTAQGQSTESPARAIAQVPDKVKQRPGVQAIKVQAVKHVRHHRISNDLTLATRLSTWRSPTDSLLKTSGDDMLMSLPKLGESLRTLRSYRLDELN